MSATNWTTIFESFNTKRVLVVGDAMIDAYMWGHINRQSPEAPIPIVDISKHEQRLGGAANVAVNIKSLGAIPILCTVVGSDKSSFTELMNQQNLTTEGVLFENRKTTTKTRIIAENKHQLRVDEEDLFPIQNESEFIDNTSRLMQTVDVVILQDYNKGVLTPHVIKTLCSNAKSLKKHLLVDPKKDNYWDYQKADLFKPNLNELQQSCAESIDINKLDALSAIVQKQRQKLKAKLFLLTLSQHGVFIQNNDHSQLYPAFKRQVIDVSGAGDSVIATAALALACELHTDQIAQLSNLAGGLACEKVGVNPTEKERLLEEASRLI